MSHSFILKMKLNHLFSVTEELEEKKYDLVKLRRELQQDCTFGRTASGDLKAKALEDRAGKICES